MPENVTPRCACGRYVRHPSSLPPFQVGVGFHSPRTCRCGRVVHFVRGMSITTAGAVRWLPSWHGWEVFVT